MRHLLLLLGSIVIINVSAFAQDSLMALLDDDEEKIEYTTASFKSTKVILGQSVENPKNGNLNFLIQHQFGSVKGGAYEFWGLDQATLRLGLEYGINDWLSVGIGRSTVNKTYDASSKIRILRQSKGKKVMPITLSFVTGVYYNSLKWNDPEKENLERSRYSYLNQLLIARKFSEQFTLQLSPTLIHRNLTFSEEEEHDVISIAPSARFKISKRISINAEYFWLIPGYTSDNFEDAFNISLDVETGGHVFQLYITNAQAIQEPYFIAATTGKWTEGNIRLAFNIVRTFVLKKSDSFKKYENTDDE